MRLIIILIILFHCIITKAQTEAKKDSLLRVYNSAQTDSAKAQLLLNISKLYHTADEARPWIDSAMNFSKKKNYGLGIANSLTNYNLYLFTEGKHDEVLKNCSTGIALATPYKAHKTIGVFYNYMANVHGLRGEHRVALENYLKALDEIKKSDAPPNFQLSIEGNIIKLYSDLRQYNKALQLGLESISKAEQAGLEYATGYICQSVAICYKEVDSINLSKKYWDKCLRIANETEDAHLTAAALSNLAEIYSDEGNKSKALEYYNRSIGIARKNEDKEIEMWGLHGLALEHYYNKEWNAAYDLTQQALKMGEENNYREYLTNLYLLLSDIEIGRGNLTASREWRSKWSRLRTELTNEDVIHATKELETKYATQEKEQRLNVLQKEKNIQALNIKQKNMWLWGLALLLLLTTVTGLIYYRFNRQKQLLAKQEYQLQEQKIKQLEQEKQLSAVSGVLRGQEEERSRLAKDIHDGLGGMLSGVKSTLTAMKNDQIINEGSATTFNRVLNALDNSITELRRVARNLMPEALIHFGLNDALRDYCQNLSEAERFNIQYQAFGLEERLPQQTEIIIFRIVQELLNNIQKHANATEVIVQLVKDDSRLHITVEDNGKGFDMATGNKTKGVGLLSIQSRVEYLNGELDINSGPGKGTIVNIECKI